MSNISVTSNDSSSSPHSDFISTAEQRKTQKRRKALIEKTNRSMESRLKSTASSLPSSRRNSKPGERKCSKKSRGKSRDSPEHSRGRDVTKSSKPRRSRSLITLTELANPYHANDLAKNHPRFRRKDLDDNDNSPTASDSPEEASSKSEEEEDSSDDAETYNTFPLSAKSKSMKKYEYLSRSHEQRHNRQLRKAIDRLNEVLINVQESKSRSRRSTPSGDSRKHTVFSVPSLHERTKLDEIASTIDLLSEQLHNDVTSFIVLSSKDRDCLNELRKDNANLNLQLQKALLAQTNMEAHLSELAKEKGMLEYENKNLAMKIVPFMTDKLHPSSRKTRTSSPRPSRPKTVDTNRNVTERSMPSVSRERDRDPFHHVEPPPPRKSQGERGIPEKKSRWSSRRIQEKYGHSRHATPSISKTSFTTGMDGYTDVDEAYCEEHENNCSQRDELDSITSYVRRKREDVGRLEGELHKYQSMTNKLRQKIVYLTQEHQVTLADFGDIVDSYRELEEERDNYECILKLILREKSSSESNLHALLDDLIKQLSSSIQLQSASQDLGSDNNSEFSFTDYGASSKYNRFSSKDFLQSVLQVIQGQNISLREEMTCLRESLNETAGKNMLLQSNNDALVEKVQEMKKMLEVKDQEGEDKNKGLQERYEELEKDHQKVLKEKTGLESTLKGKERELAQVQRIVDKTKKDGAGYNEKIIKLQDENENLAKETISLQNEIEDMNQTISNLRSCLKDESGVWCERLKTASREVSSSKDQCKWLQSQIEKLNVQLKDAYERIKLHEQDKAILAQKVLSAEEERKTLDRKILEIKSIMQGDTVYRQALAERNEVLQLKINRLRQKALSCGYPTENDISSESDLDSRMKEMSSASGAGAKPGDGQDTDTENRNNFSGDRGNELSTIDELSSQGSAPPEKVATNHQVSSREAHVTGDATPLSRKYCFNQHRRHHRGISPGSRRFQETPRAAVSLHNPPAVCYRGRMN